MSTQETPVAETVIQLRQGLDRVVTRGSEWVAISVLVVGLVVAPVAAQVPGPASAPAEEEPTPESTSGAAELPQLPDPPPPFVTTAVDASLKEVPTSGQSFAGTPHHSAPVRVGEVLPQVVNVSKLPPAPKRSADQPRTSPSQGDNAYAEEADQHAPVVFPGDQRGQFFTPDGDPAVEVDEPVVRGGTAGTHIREFEGIDDTGSFPPDMVMAVGSRHAVEAVNRGFAVYDKFGNEVQGYRTLNSLFSPASGFSLFDPKIIWSRFHNKFALMALGRNTTTQDSRFYLAVSQSPNAMGNWWTYSFNAEALGDTDAWLDYASLGGDLWGLYVTGQMLNWTGGTKHSKLWAISPNAWTGGGVNSWIWLDLEWPNGTNARMLEMAHPHTEAFDEASFFVNTYINSGSDALIWRLVGDRHSGAGLSLTRSLVDIDDYDAIAGNVDQPGSAIDIHGFFAQPNNAVYVNRRVFFSQTTDVQDNGTSSGMLTTRVNVDNQNVEWDDLHWSGAGRYYFFPALAFRGSGINDNLALFYSYTKTVAPTSFASAGYKVFLDQPNSDDGPFVIYQGGQASYVRIDSFGRNRWGDYGGASYDWECGHLWGVAEFAGTGNNWRTRMKVLNGDGEGTCSMISVVSPNGGEQVFAGDTITVDWERSAVPAGTSLYVMYNDGSTNTTISPALPTSASSFQWTVPNNPTDEAQIWVGAWNGSSWELGDWSDLDFEIVGRPDLVTQIAAPASAYTGHPIAVSNGISNIGEASGSISVAIALSVNSLCTTFDQLLFQRFGGSLPAGQVSNAVSNVTIPLGTPPGEYTLCSYADWSDTIEEFDEGNNADGTTIQIMASELFLDGFESGNVSAWSSSVP